MCLGRHPRRRAANHRVDATQTCREIGARHLLRCLQQKRVAHVAQLYFLSILAAEDVCALQITVHKAPLMKVDQRAQNLLCVHSCVLLTQPLAVLSAHLGEALVDVLEVDAKNVIVNNL